ncbi:MAG TPA: hypothetical protein VND62_02045 [Acidimicrobiales bacterium]|nr:hypothetical protein [Acidimicrobiales bacterium]
MTVERHFDGSVFDVADARRFAGDTARWWGVDAGSLEDVIGELSRRAVCSERPGFRVSLTLDRGVVNVQVAEEPPGSGRPEGPVHSLRPRSAARGQ